MWRKRRRVSALLHSNRMVVFSTSKSSTAQVRTQLMLSANWQRQAEIQITLSVGIASDSVYTRKRSLFSSMVESIYHRSNYWRMRPRFRRKSNFTHSCPALITLKILTTNSWASVLLSLLRALICFLGASATFHSIAMSNRASNPESSRQSILG